MARVPIIKITHQQRFLPCMLDLQRHCSWNCHQHYCHRHHDHRRCTQVVCFHRVTSIALIWRPHDRRSKIGPRSIDSTRNSACRRHWWRNLVCAMKCGRKYGNYSWGWRRKRQQRCRNPGSKRVRGEISTLFAKVLNFPCLVALLLTTPPSGLILASYSNL